MKIEKIDPNFSSNTIGDLELKSVNVQDVPECLHGFPWFKEEKCFRRLPTKLSDNINDGVKSLAECSAGVRVRFKTDSKTIGIKATMKCINDMGHMPRSGYAGFDLYTVQDNTEFFSGNIFPDFQSSSLAKLFPAFNKRENRELVIYLPLYSGVESLEIGIEPEASFAPATPYRINKPILYYGSSITQGGCASRQGTAYQGFISRWLNADFINLGFSGSAKGEPEMAELIASREQSAFVLDYDHNAPNVEYLAATHDQFFQIFRDTQPTTPVVMVSMPDFKNNPDNIEVNTQRRKIIRKTYLAAQAAGDQQVFFVDGETLFGNDNVDACTVDRCHPNDIGFFRMAKGISVTLQKALRIII